MKPRNFAKAKYDPNSCSFPKNLNGKRSEKIPIGGTTGGGTGGRDLDKIEYEVNEDEECCRTATLADISELFKLAASPFHIQQCHCCLFSSLNILKL